MEVYRVYVRPHNVSDDLQGTLEFYVRAENERIAILAVLNSTVGLTQFAQLSINPIPNGVIIDNTSK